MKKKVRIERQNVGGFSVDCPCGQKQKTDVSASKEAQRAPLRENTKESEKEIRRKKKQSHNSPIFRNRKVVGERHVYVT